MGTGFDQQSVTKLLTSVRISSSSLLFFCFLRKVVCEIFFPHPRGTGSSRAGFFSMIMGLSSWISGIKQGKGELLQKKGEKPKFSTLENQDYLLLQKAGYSSLV